MTEVSHVFGCCGWASSCLPLSTLLRSAYCFPSGDVNKKWQSWRSNAELSGIGPPVKYVPPAIKPQYYGPIGSQPEVGAS